MLDDRCKLREPGQLCRQHRFPGGVPQAVARVQQCGEGHRLPQQAHRHRQTLPPDTVGGRRPEDHRQQQVDP